MKISIHTIGCKLNQAESDEIKKELRRMGYCVIPFNQAADIAIIRACAVTAGASQTTREMIRQAKRRGSYVIASGCLENAELPEIDYVAQTANDIFKKIQLLSAKIRVNNVLSAKTSESADRTRAFVKIQNGCNFNCTYCAIPHFRGRSKCEPPSAIIKKIWHAEKSGYKEVVLTGVNICQYHSGKTKLAQLLSMILEQTKIERIRLGSLDPRLISDEFVTLFKDTRLMPHWHLSLQSGSDNVLKRMNRGYTANKFLSITKQLRKINPLFSVTTDIIAGFPGESDNEFNETMAFVKKVGFSKVHVFPYSKRPNTPASEMSDQIHDKIKTERVKRLIKLSDEIGKRFTSKLRKKKKAVLFEYQKNGYWFGYTPEYTLTRYRSNKNLKNQIINIK